MIAPIILGFVLSLLHYLFDSYAHKLKRYHVVIVSISSGLFVSYIFLSMFPEVARGRDFFGDAIYFIAFWGFVLLHIGEKYVSLHYDSRHLRRKRLIQVRTFVFILNHILLGATLAFFFKLGQPLQGYLSFFPLLAHIITSSLLIEDLHKNARETFFGKIFASGSVFVGVLLALAFPLSDIFFKGAFAFITGVFLYIIVRDVIPPNRRGDPRMFLVGIIIYLIILAVEFVLLG